MLQEGKCPLPSLICSSLRSGLLTEGLQLFQQGLQEAFPIDDAAFVGLFSAFAKRDASVVTAKRMHAHAIGNGSVHNVMVGTSLIHMYGKLGLVESAMDVFHSVPIKTVITWNATISALVQAKRNEEAFRFLDQMVCEGIPPVRVTFVSVITACASEQDLARGMRVHTVIVNNGLSSDVVVQTTVVSMYGKCGKPDAAKSVFDQIIAPNVVSWTVMITVCAENRQSMQAFRLLSSMQSKGLAPNDVTFIPLLGLCAFKSLLAEGMQMHTFIIALGFDLQTVVSNTLLNFYSKCGCLLDAHKIFLAMPDKDIVSWNVMMLAYTCSGRYAESLDLFKEMYQFGVKPTKASFSSALDACAHQGTLQDVYKVHFCTVTLGLDQDQTLGNATINAYGIFNSYYDAHAVFDSIGHNETVTWNAMIGTLVRNEYCDVALVLQQKMILECVIPNNVSFVTVFSACSTQERLLRKGKELHACLQLDSQLLSDMTVQNCILNMYSRCDSLLVAQNAFFNMTEHNNVSWNILISTYAQNNCEGALQFFHTMLCEGLIPDEMSYISVLNACAREQLLLYGKRIHIHILASQFSEQNLYLWNAVVDMYSKCNDLDDAWKVFNEISIPELVTWNIIIIAFVEDNLSLTMYNDMLQKGNMPDEVTFLALISACASQALLRFGKQVHACLNLYSNLVMDTNLVKMYGSCGQVAEASGIFHAMVDRSVPSWNAILTACAQSGLGAVALKLFRQMQEECVRPDEISFICLLSACNHEGLIEEACQLLYVMKYTEDMEMIEDHYSCLIDALGRAGQLEQAEGVFRAAPFHDSLLLLMTFLGSCKTHMDLTRGKKVIMEKLSLDETVITGYWKLLDAFNTIIIQDNDCSC